MEIFELRYFLGVAKFENIHRASEKLRISPGSLSKAITRLEEELSVKLFSREGRHIRLTDQGRLLQRRAAEMMRLEENTRIEIGGHLGVLQVAIAGPEILLTKLGLGFAKTIRSQYPHAHFEFHATDDESAIEQVARGEAHFALVTADIPKNIPVISRQLSEAKFITAVGKGHPLYALAKAKKVISIEELLQHGFVSPSNPILGRVGLKQSLDGWRDDQFPRKVEYLTSSLKILEEIVVSGRAVAYLPDYFCENLNLEVLKVTGCPYSCVQKVKLVVKSSKEIGWMNQIF